MSLLSLIMAFVVVGVILWLVNTYIPMDASVKKLMNIAVIIILALWVLNATGLLGSLDAVRVR